MYSLVFLAPFLLNFLTDVTHIDSFLSVFQALLQLYERLWIFNEALPASNDRFTKDV